MRDSYLAVVTMAIDHWQSIDASSFETFPQNNATVVDLRVKRVSTVNGRLTRAVALQRVLTTCAQLISYIHKPTNVPHVGSGALYNKPTLFSG